jgi:autotransporter-associated beta strand protein
MTGGSIASTGAGKLVLASTNLSANLASTSATISGNLDLNGISHEFIVANDSPPVDLDISAVISNGSFGKSGLGTLRLDGSAANTYSGTSVLLGTLELGKLGGTLAVPGDLVVQNGGVAREIASNQIANTSTVTVVAGGTFDLSGFTDVIGPLTVNGTVTIGAGTLTAGPVTMTGGNITSTGAGSLVLQGDVTTIGSSDTATISGNLNLGGFTRTFTVPNGVANFDLDISATITNGGLTKSGGGTLRISGTGNNTYPGLTTVSAGTLELAKSSLGFAMGGNLTIDAVVRQSADNQLGTATTVTVNHDRRQHQLDRRRRVGPFEQPDYQHGAGARHDQRPP